MTKHRHVGTSNVAAAKLQIGRDAAIPPTTQWLSVWWEQQAAHTLVLLTVRLCRPAPAPLCRLRQHLLCRVLLLLLLGLLQ
jgi:hypothetical protein